MQDGIQDNTVITTLAEETPPFIPADANVMTSRLDIPRDPGSPPHRHSGSVFGYVLEGELRFELEGEAERVIPPGGAFSEPGGDLVHYQAANNLPDVWTRVLVVMACAPGQPMLTYVDEDELVQRAHLRGPRPQ